MKSRPNILIVDDNETNLYTLRKVLERMEVNIHSALSGKEAISLAKKNVYSLALIDIQMPEMDGFETLTRVRALKGNEHMPVVLISAIYTEDQYRIRGMETGAVDFIPKPVSPEVIRAKVRVFLDLEQQRASLKALNDDLKESNRQLKSEIIRREAVEDELRKARAMAEKTSEIKSQMLVNMSHEIRTPVNSILGFADMIVNPDISPTDKERYLKYVTNSSQNLLFLIDEILEHSRLDAGEMKISSGPCDIDNLLGELLELFTRIKEQSGKNELTLTWHKPEKRGLVIRTDYQRLRQVLTNLLHNAVKYSQKGEIRFGFILDKSDIEFFVKDQGIGISKEDLSGIFTRFKRLGESSELNAPGTGLGLSLSKRIVELMNGTIWVNSAPDVGSEFRFRIPIEIMSRVEEKTKPEGREDEIPDWSSRTLLIAEDEEMNYLFLLEALKSSGIRVLWAKNGQAAVDLVESDPSVDLVLMDIKMPDMDGYEATKKIKVIRHELPVIIQTAFALSDEKERSFEKGCDDFITKPINRRLLIKTIKRFLNQ